MVFSFLLKFWNKLRGFIRLASRMGFWAFLSSMVHMAAQGNKFVKCANFKGKPLPMFGAYRDEEEFIRVLETEVINFPTREDDVFVVAYAKSGHHWSYDFIAMLLRGDLVLDDEVKEVAFIEFVLGVRKNMDVLKNMASPRIIFTHYPAEALPKEIFTKKRKIVRLIRNPKDVAVSGFYHLGNMVKQIGWNSFVDEVMDTAEGKVTDGENPFAYPGGDWFDYEKECEAKLNHLEHTLVLHYEDLKDNMLPQLRRLTSFLGKDYDDAFLSQVAARTNINYVKSNKDLSMHDAMMKKGSLYRKGVIGDWRNHFTVEQNDRFDSIISEKMQDCSLMDRIRFFPLEMEKKNK